MITTHFGLLAAMVSSILVNDASAVSAGDALLGAPARGAIAIIENGNSHNGVLLNGTALDNLAITGVRGHGVSAAGAAIEASALFGRAAAPALGSVWEAELSSGATLPLRIDGVVTLPVQSAHARAYEVSYFTPEGAMPLCGLEGGRPIPAIAVPGVFDTREGVPGGGSYAHDPARFTFACRGKAIAKCVELGYAPASGLPADAPADDREGHFVACTRMIRADYCGDGRSWTRDGTLINLYDGIGVQKDAGPWAVEAEWTEDGARCANEARATRLMVSRRPGTPECFAALRSTSCGAASHFRNGTRLVSEMVGAGK
ncbi:MAG: ADYC domain-containing protein [Byssovorax sp.]